MRNLISILFLFCLIGCSVFEEDKKTRIIPAESVKEITISGRSVNFNVSCRIPTPCWEFYKYEETVDETYYFIKFFAKITDQAVCPQVVSSLDAYYKVNVLKNGEYIFHFFQNDTTGLDTIIVIQ